MNNCIRLNNSLRRRTPITIENGVGLRFFGLAVLCASELASSGGPIMVPIPTPLS